MSQEDDVCLICLGGPDEHEGFLDSTCKCKGSNKTHMLCLVDQIFNGFRSCGVCKSEFNPIYKARSLIIHTHCPTKIQIFQYNGQKMDGFSRIYKYIHATNEKLILSIGHFSNGKKNGEFTDFSYKDGKQYVSKITNYSNNILNGPLLKLYPNGVHNTFASYCNNKLHGTYLRRYENNIIMQQCNYHHGQYHGSFASYYPNGSTDTICEYQYNKLHGQYKKFKVNGDLYKHIIYNNGILDKVIIDLSVKAAPVVAPVAAPLQVVPKDHLPIKHVRRNSI